MFCCTYLVVVVVLYLYLIINVVYLVAASGTIGLEHREDMCRLEFSVCVWPWRGNYCGSRVPYTIQAQAI